MISAKILLDSVNVVGARLTTFELVYPRFILAELNTYRVFSRNSASSRAIPIEKMIQRIEENPAGPVFWAKNQKGMQAVEELPDDDWAIGSTPPFSSRECAKATWLEACKDAVRHSRRLAELGAHKAIANRLTEPFQHMTTILTGTDFANLFFQRCHKDAQQEFQVLAREMYRAYTSNRPTVLMPGQWHMPYMPAEDRHQILLDAYSKPLGDVAAEEEAEQKMIRVSVGRCARVSYLNHNGVRDFADDLALFDKLVAGADDSTPGHFSPLEHVARAEADRTYHGNIKGFTQLRKMYAFENRTTLPTSEQAGV